MLKKLLVLLFTLLSIAQAEMLISSQSHIKIQNGYSILDDENRLIVTTDGGILRFNKNDDSYKTPEFFGVEAGLPGVKIAGACIDSRNNYWFATAEGVVSVQNSDLDKIAAFNDISTTNSSSLIAITASQKYIYLVTDKILVRYVFNPSSNRYQVKDSNLNSGTIRSFGLYNGHLYLFSDKLRFISENAPNISDITLWQENNFPAASSINQLKIVGQQFLALASDGIYAVNQAVSSKQAILVGQNILDAGENHLTIGKTEEYPFGFFFLTKKTNNSIALKYTTDLTVEPAERFAFWDSACKRFSIAQGNIFFLAGNGYKTYNLQTDKWQTPQINQPNFRYILNACVSGSKIIYGSYTTIAAGDYQSRIWSPLKTNLSGYSDHTRFFEAGNNTILGAYWGRGVQLFNLTKNQYSDDSIAVRDKVLFQSAYSSGEMYSVAHACAKDKNGNFWIGNFYVSYLNPATTPVLVKLPSLNQSGSQIEQNSVKYYLDQLDFKKSSCMVIDSQSRIWLGAKQEITGIALAIPQGQTLTSKIVLTGYSVYSMAIDQNNILWLGTSIGAKYIVLDEITKPDKFTLSSIKTAAFTTAGQEVRNIHITANNEKWFATSGGVTILKNNDQDVYHLIQNYSTPDQPLAGTVEEIPMLAKDVINIFELPQTKQTLLVFQDGFVIYDFAKGSVRNEISETVTYPAPFLADGSAEVTFYIPDNGINYKFVKIFDLKGRLVKKITRNFSAGQVNWNGRDDDNNLVSSGIYQYIVYSEENGQKFLKGKMAVVRK